MWMFSKKKPSEPVQYTTTAGVNGKIIRVSGSSIAIVNNKIIIDGKPLEEALDAKNITVIVEGDCKEVDTLGDVEIRGNCGVVDCGGSCYVSGSVDGTIDAGGSITCGNVKGNVDAGGSVTCGEVIGDIDAGGSVRCARH